MVYTARINECLLNFILELSDNEEVIAVWSG
jgi:hypothetical protein